MKTATLLISATLFFCLFTCSCDKTKKHTKIEKIHVESDEEFLPDPQFITDKSEKQIIFISDTLYKGDTLKIKFKTPHSKELGIVTPDDKFFFAVYDFNNSIVDWNKFANMEYLEIITDKTKIDPWDARIKGNQIAFTKTGEYKIQLSENLDTDDGTPVETEKIYYIDNYRK